jgi:hypothetical protein
VGTLTQLGIGIAVIVFLFGGLIYLSSYIERRRHYHMPIICVCEVNGRIGIVLRDDYHKASKEYWKRYYDGKAHYDFGHVSAPFGRRLKVGPMFNFKAGSDEYYTICAACYVEHAVFDVPAVYKDEPSQMAEAYQYFHGKPWDGKLISW